MAFYNVLVPWDWMLTETWPKLSSGAQALYLDVCRLACKGGWHGLTLNGWDGCTLPYTIRLMHKDVRTGQCPETFRRARKELCGVGILRRERHDGKGTPLRDFFSLRKPPEG